MDQTPVSFQWRNPSQSAGFRRAVSLHGHTYYSKELLNFIPRYARNIPGLKQAVERKCAKYKQVHGVEMDFNRGWWTPPVSPKGAFALEQSQIALLGMEAMISLSDHDDIQAPLELQARSIAVPISVEWTVPLSQSFIHLGIHNLPANLAPELFKEMQSFTAHPEMKRLSELLSALHEIPEILIVLNHPLWDEPGIGDKLHRDMVDLFLKVHGAYIDALELNGLRPWTENAEVKALAASLGKPSISGGDRHATEPNACLNITNAATFSEFVSEIRDGHSHLLFMPQYSQAPGARITHMVIEIMAHHQEHDLGWVNWSDRVFYHTLDRGVLSLTECWLGKGPSIVQAFAFIAGVISHRRIRPAVSYAFGPAQDFASPAV